LWITASELSSNELGGSPDQIGWALGNLIELHLIATQIKNRPKIDGAVNHLDKARQYARQLATTRTTDEFQIYSTRRQLKRYAWWFAEMEALGKLRTAAHELLALLPEKRN